jgi:DNA-binding XRE family transcriptional regulator
MKDGYIQSVDDRIESLKRDYWETREGEGEAILFDILREMDSKITYIAKYPERAKNHYNPNQDIPMIKELRRLLGFNQENLGDFLGVARETVSRWETGSIILSDERRKQIKTLLDQYQNHRAGESLFVSFDTLTIYDNINKETKQ